ncbi:MAG TPA: GvpL/GvpF family gas vesicle protein, partial [Microlunatus sp.]|nr:GvpL/GvpF family gas vesicle protein [Microlunatus sp.]
MSEVASYVYLVSRGLTDDDVPEVAGQQDRPVRLVPAAGLVAVVGTVDLAEFGEEALRRNLEDLAWLERTARAHDRVVDAVARRATVAPWRLATILLDDARVAALVTQRRADLERVLDRVHGCREWSVKAYAPAGAPPDEPAGAPPDERAGPRPESGTAYLIRRKAETTRRTAAAAALAESAEDLHLALSAPTRA